MFQGPIVAEEGACIIDNAARGDCRPPMAFNKVPAIVTCRPQPDRHERPPVREHQLRVRRGTVYPTGPLLIADINDPGIGHDADTPRCLYRSAFFFVEPDRRLRSRPRSRRPGHTVTTANDTASAPQHTR
jgi:hypothetical protein